MTGVSGPRLPDVGDEGLPSQVCTKDPGPWVSVITVTSLSHPTEWRPNPPPDPRGSRDLGGIRGGTGGVSNKLAVPEGPGLFDGPRNAFP